MPQHGVTTVVTGNCSLSLTPVRAADRVAASDVFGFIEDIPVDAFTTGIPWTWESYAEWRDALQAHGTAVNIAALIGHSNLRVYVMGDDAWTRAATPEELARLTAVLAESLAAGALGMSTSFVDQDRHGHAVPSRAADDDELRALSMCSVGRPATPACWSSCPGSRSSTVSSSTSTAWRAWCGDVDVSCTWNQLAENSRDPSRRQRILEQAHALHAEGCRVYGQVSPRPFDLHVSFDQTPAFVAIPAWGKFIALPTAEEKRAKLTDPEWRAAARKDWDRVGDGFTIFPVSRLDRVRLTSVREGEEQFLDRSFADLVAARGGHPSDVLADWVLEHDLAPGMVAEALSNNNAERVSELIVDATTVVGASDAGAHLQMMCGAGDSTLLLTEHVRDRGDLTVEQGVHQMTGRIARGVRHPRPRRARAGSRRRRHRVRARRARLPPRPHRARPPRRRAAAHPPARWLPGHRGRGRRDPGGRRRHRRPPRRAPRRQLLANTSRLTVVYTRQL